jgi:hypothetical protein
VEIKEGPGTVPGPIYCNRIATRNRGRSLWRWRPDRPCSVEVRVGAQCELDVRLAQEFLHELWVHTPGEKDRGTSMSQVLEADVWQSRLLEERLEVAALCWRVRAGCRCNSSYSGKPS